MARIVVKICVSSALKIWTMFRLPKDSSTLKTYVPAGRICASTPGTSNGSLNVMTVFLSNVSARTFAAKTTATRAKEQSNATTLSVFIFKLPVVDRFIKPFFDSAPKIMTAAQKSRRFGCVPVVVLDPSSCSGLRRSALHQILTGRRNCDMYSIVIIMSLFNKEQEWEQLRSFRSGENQGLL